jgi:DNA-binding response OmpR family regulator
MGQGIDRAERLLIVDDVQDDRDLLIRYFTRRGYECVFAEDGEAALLMTSKERFDLVLLDILMPGLDGMAVLRRMRQDHCRNELPVIMVSVKGERRDIVEALETGANDYVVKPSYSVAVERARVELGRRRAENAADRDPGTS